MHEENSYLTLSYDEINIPEHDSLLKSDFQKFIRSLRQATKQKIRYFMCGEYGDKTSRPHYHAILFGYDFPDKELWQIRDKTKRVYRSKELEHHWTYGNSEIGSVNFATCGYVARYIIKKQNGARAKAHYGKRLPEYTQMSLRPGIGKSWYLKYKADIFPDDTVIHNGRKYPAPKYYRALLAKEDPVLYEKLRALRIEKAQNNPDNTEDRLAVREKCKLKQAERLERNYL